MMKKLSIILAALLCLTMAACGEGKSSSSEPSSDPSASSVPMSDIPIPDPDYATKPVVLKQFEEPTGPVATMKTTLGDIEIMLFPEEAPKAVENFITHAQNGYYEGIIFHRVIDGFMIQGGDPDGIGTGGTSIWGNQFEDEFSDNLHNFRGALSMANAGPDTNGSQFFIMQAPTAPAMEGYEDYVYSQYLVHNARKRIAQLSEQFKDDDEAAGYINAEQAKLDKQLADGTPADYVERMSPVIAKYNEVGGSPNLDNKHTVFGHVISGMEVVDQIAKVQTGENDKPVEDIKILSITIKE